MSERKDNMTRRGFLKGAAAMAAAPLILPSSVLGLAGHTAPGDRITVAYIGTGGWCSGAHLPADVTRDDIQIVAVCDVRRARREKARKMVANAYAQRKGSRSARGVKAYNDFREILARPDVDAVVVTTLHYWHAVMAILAARAGKHVYVEKMCTTTLGEGRAMADAVRRCGVVFQHGTQGRSMYTFRHAAELVRNGRIGKVVRVEATYIDMGKVHPGRPGPVGAWTSGGKEVPVPDGLDWDLYLGPCPWKPYTGDLNVGGLGFGALADFGSHPVDSAQMVLGMDGSGPVEIYPGGTAGHERLCVKYANGVELVPPADPGDPEISDFGIRVVGTEGTVAVDRGGCRVSPAHLDRKPVGPNDRRINPNVAVPVGRATSKVVSSNTRGTLPNEDSWAWVGANKSNWFHCIRTGQKTNAHEEIGHRSASVGILIHMAYALRRPLKWDPAKEQFTGDEEANRLKDYPKRSPWQVY